MMSFDDVVTSVQTLAPTEKVRLIGIIADQLAADEYPPYGPVFQAGWQVTSDEAGLRAIYEAAGIKLPNE